MTCSPTQKAFVRMQAIRALMMGFDHQQVAALFMKTRRTIDEWIRHFSRDGGAKLYHPGGLA